MVIGCCSLLPEMRVLPITGQVGSSLSVPLRPNNFLYHTITRRMMNPDYDTYELNILDTTRIQPLLNQIKLNDLSFRFFISSVYWNPTSFEVVQRHNREIRRTIRNFFNFLHISHFQINLSCLNVRFVSLFLAGFALFNVITTMGTTVPFWPESFVTRPAAATPATTASTTPATTSTTATTATTTSTTTATVQ